MQGRGVFCRTRWLLVTQVWDVEAGFGEVGEAIAPLYSAILTPLTITAIAPTRKRHRSVKSKTFLHLGDDFTTLLNV